MIRITPFHRELGDIWNKFVRSAKNGSFLFDRDYMDYHSDRFVDASLLFHEGEELVGLLPASIAGDVLSSHGGLTFGGVISDDRMRTGRMLEIFEAMRRHYGSLGVLRIDYKPVPHIYHRLPAEEDLYALFRAGARLVRRDVSASVRSQGRPPYTKGRRYSVNRSQKTPLELTVSEDFHEFMLLEEEHLLRKFNTRPVHSGAEMQLLASRFPANIRLHVARHEGELLCGVIIYESDQVAHAQYIASTDKGKQLCALDALVNHLLTVVYVEKPIFDFGISTEKQGQYLNSGLMENKESYGARAVVYDFYQFNTSERELD